MPTSNFDGSGNPNINADYYNDVVDLLTKLPNNTANLIKAKDVRDSVWTLWCRIDDIESLIVSNPPALFENPDPTPLDVGGIPAGSTFPTPTNMQDMWDMLLYPYIAPGASLSGGRVEEFGGNPNIFLNWSVTKKSNPITSIIVDGNSILPNGGDQTGIETSTGSYPTTPVVSHSNVFTMSVTDGTDTTNRSTTLTWNHRIYWGKINITGNPNLTLNPGLVNTLVSPLIDSSTLISLIGAGGAGIGTGSDLKTSKTKTYDGINGSGDFLIFAWPSSFSGSTTPIFKVNGLLNTAFTSVKTSWLFTNQFGYDNNYEVWISNTIQNSPLFIEIS